MLYMIIGHFHIGKVKELCKRFEKKGRMMPEGLQYLNSWTDEKVTPCYQVMEGDSEEKIQEWLKNWKTWQI